MSDNQNVDPNAAPDASARTAARAPKVDQTWVISGLTGENRDKVAISEWDPAHPENSEGKTEIFVAGHDSPPQKVAKTPEVVRHLREGELVEISADDAQARLDKHAAKMADRRKAAFEAQNPEITRALAAHGVRLGDLMSGDTSAADVAAAVNADKSKK